MESTTGSQSKEKEKRVNTRLLQAMSSDPRHSEAITVAGRKLRWT